MRIALVCRELPPAGGGIGSYTQKTARTLASIGNEVHIFTEAEGRQPSVDLTDGVRIHLLPRSGLKPRVLFRALAVDRALRANGPFDVVQACEWGAEASLFALHPTAPLITRLATPHFVIDRWNRVPLPQRVKHTMSRVLERVQVWRSSRIITPSRAMALEAARGWGLKPESFSVVPTGIAIPTGVDSDANPFAGRRYLLYFGRMEARKGIDVWLAALPAVLGAFPDVEAVFVGEDMGIDGRPVVSVARDLCGEFWPRLHFVAHTPHAQLFPIVAGAALTVMPSRWENLANTCLEAMVLGRVVVATTGSGFAEVIDSGVDGFLVPPGDARALADQVVAILGDPALLARAGAAAAAKARAFDLVTMVERLVGVYRDVVGSGAFSAASRFSEGAGQPD